MIKEIDLSNDSLARTALNIQLLAYRIEADLIGFDDIPPLHETLDDLKNSSETFAGYFIEDNPVAIISYSIEDKTLDIGRLVVHPDYFRRGIGQALLGHVETVRGISRIIVSTGKGNHPAQSLYEQFGYQSQGELILTETLTITCYEKRLA